MNDAIKAALQISLKLTSSRGELLVQKNINKLSRAKIIKLTDEIEKLTLRLQEAVEKLK